VPHRRHSYGYVYDFPVLSASTRFEMFDSLAASDPFEDDPRFRLLAWRQDEGYRFADDFFRAIAEYDLGAAIPVGHDAVECFTDDGVVRRRDDRGKTVVEFLVGLTPQEVDQNAASLERFPWLRDDAPSHPKP